MNPQSNVAVKRQLRHQEIRTLMVSGELDQAIVEFHEAITTHGSHVGLLCDLAGCYYELGRFHECDQIVDLICEEYEKAEHLLSNTSKRRTALMLAKFFEEGAKVAEALQWLTKAQEYCETLDDKKWIAINELRLLSYFGLKKDLQKRYVTVLELYNKEDSLKIEVLHGLCWAEWALFGYTHAVQRWRELQKYQMNDIDRRLVARDFIEISILARAPSNQVDLGLACAILSDADKIDYDKALLSQMERTQHRASRVDSSEELQLSLMMRIRLLLLMLKQESDGLRKIEYLKKFSFLVGCLSPASQELFGRIQPTVEGSKFILSLHVSNKKLICQNPGFEIKMTSLQVKLIKSASKNRTLSLDQVSNELWGCDSSESIYHRLRMLIYKLNEQIHAELGIKLLEIKKEGISLHLDVQIEIKL